MPVSLFNYEECWYFFTFSLCSTHKIIPDSLSGKRQDEFECIANKHISVLMTHSSPGKSNCTVWRFRKQGITYACRAWRQSPGEGQRAPVVF